MTKKKLSFRQRLRDGAENKLDKMVSTMQAAATRVIEEHDSNINEYLLMQLASQPIQGKTLRHDLVTKLANEAEQELEALYNDQHKLDLGEGDD
jgi:hypothetical protein